MDAKKLQFDVFSGLESHFDFLPDELLLCIFNKISDLKNLCHCFLVSKRFASVISQIRSVSFTLPQSEAYSHESCNSVVALFHEVLDLTGDELHRFLEQYFRKLKLPISLEKFPKLESIHVEYTCPKNDDDDNSSLFKWKVNCKSYTALPTSIVAMRPVSVHKRSEFVPCQMLMTTDFFKSRINECFWSSFGCYFEWLFLIYMLATCHATIRSVTVTDSHKKGKLAMNDEQLFSLRSGYPISDEVVRNRNVVLKLAWVPELHLPVSGYVMRGVCFVAVKFLNESDASGEEGDDIFTWDYEEEEKVFGEVIKEVFKNHRDKFQPPL